MIDWLTDIVLEVRAIGFVIVLLICGALACFAIAAWLSWRDRKERR